MRRWICALAIGLAAAAVAQPTFPHPDRIRYDGQCFTIEGKDTFVFSGAFHYFRCPKELWAERFRRIKEAGFNAVETYVAWNWHEQAKPKDVNDFSKMDLTELDEWLTMAEKQFGLYTIVRPGPYICSEWATGGYPNWLPAFKPANPKRSMWFRSDDPVYLAWCRHWYQAVAKVVAKHQITRVPKGQKGVILWQVENEYDYAGMAADAKRTQVRELIRYAQEGGIDVPTFGCWTRSIREANGDPLIKQAFDSANHYPRYDIEALKWAAESLRKDQPWAPVMTTELQGGWFGGVGGQAGEEQGGIDAKQINALTLYGIQEGYTSLNYYMLFGGTNFGDWGGQGMTTCYDYNAPLREWGGVGAKFRAVKAIGQFLQKYGAEIARSKPVDLGVKSDDPNVLVGARETVSGIRFLFIRNKSTEKGAKGVLPGLGIPYDLGPFGMNVCVLGRDGKPEWLVKAIPAPAARPLPAPIRLKTAEVASVEPSDWKAAPSNSTILNLGVYDSRFVYYRANVPNGSERNLWVRSVGGDIYSDLGPTTGRRSGKSWKTSGGTSTFLLFNTGWPNGGNGMEQDRGIAEARVLDDVPPAFTLTNWKAKLVANESDRSLVGEEVDDSSWASVTPSDEGQSIFKPNTVGVLRTTFMAGGKLVQNSEISFTAIDDEGWIYVNGKFVAETHDWNRSYSFPIGQFLRQGKNTIAVVLKNNEGMGGLLGTVAIEAPVADSGAHKWLWTDQLKVGAFKTIELDTTTKLSRNEHPKLETSANRGVKLVRSRVTFSVPKTKDAAWEILIEAGGDGFITLNGHKLGRYWEVGPQRGYFLPSCWLKEKNVLELTVLPGSLGDRITAAELKPLPIEE